MNLRPRSISREEWEKTEKKKVPCVHCGGGGVLPVSTSTTQVKCAFCGGKGRYLPLHYKRG